VSARSEGLIVARPLSRRSADGHFGGADAGPDCAPAFAGFFSAGRDAVAPGGCAALLVIGADAPMPDVESGAEAPVCASALCDRAAISKVKVTAPIARTAVMMRCLVRDARKFDFMVSPNTVCAVDKPAIGVPRAGARVSARVWTVAKSETPYNEWEPQPTVAESVVT
jgi:hypothetical protein